jgi:hypothetical protein
VKAAGLRHTALTLAFLGIAVLAGMVSAGRSAGSSGVESAASGASGLLRGILADALLIQMDNYHHIWTYAGGDWRDDTDYLEQLWLVSRLRPDIPSVYADGGYHLAVNLGLVEEGLAFLDRGIRCCPGDMEILWVREVVIWQCLPGEHDLLEKACLDYLSAVRAVRLPVGSNEMNTNMILGWTLESDSSRTSHAALARHYIARAEMLGGSHLLWGIPL